ncbi:hypothetical protein D9M68_845890 [compost metagenome]
MPVMLIVTKDVGHMQHTCHLCLPADQQIQTTLLQARNRLVQAFKLFKRFTKQL